MTNRDQIKETMGRAYASLNDPKLVANFKSAMDRTGLGDDPAVIEVVHRFAQSAVAKPDAVAKPERPSIAKALYPNHK